MPNSFNHQELEEAMQRVSLDNPDSLASVVWILDSNEGCQLWLASSPTNDYTPSSEPKDFLK